MEGNRHQVFARSKWERTNNPQIWRDQYDNVRNKTSEGPCDFKNGDGYKISNLTQLKLFIPKILQMCATMTPVGTVNIIQTSYISAMEKC